MRRKSFLIAGCGYLGLRVAATWKNAGHTVHAITRSSDRAEQFLSEGLEPHILDLAAPVLENSLPAVDVVLWSVGFDRTSGVSREEIWLNGLRRLVEGLPEPPRAFLYVSSTSVYGDQHQGTVTELDSTNPATEGGLCCVRGEQLIREECGRRFPGTCVSVLRMAGIYGPDRLLRRVSDLKDQVPLPGEAEQWLNLIHVDDAVRMVSHVSDRDVPPELINVVNSETLTRRAYYSELARLAGAPAPVFGGNQSNRRRGGNKRVSSVRRGDVGFCFDDVLSGLRDAWKRTETPISE